MATKDALGDVSNLIEGLRADGWSRDGIHEHLVEKEGLSHYQAEEAVDGDGTFTGVATPGANSDAGPVGIGGWLVIPTFWIVVWPLLGVRALMDAWAIRSSWSDLSPDLQRLLLAEVIGNCVMIVLSIATATSLFRNGSKAPVLATVWLLAFAVFTVLVQLGVSEATGEEPNLKVMAGAVAFALVWGLYFRASQRVKNTFVR